MGRTWYNIFLLLDLGTSDFRHGGIGIVTLTETEEVRERLQEELDASKNIDTRRLLGQFATPPILANEIVETTLPFLSPESGLKILEPSAGTGSFISACLQNFGERVSSVTALEFDRDFFKAGKRLWASFPVEYRNVDFTTTEPDVLFDLVVANPPYVRHHGLETERKRQLQQSVLSETGITISGLAGLYCHFMLLSLKWMKPGALGVWLIPAEWMSVNYGEAVRSFLSRNVRLLRIHRFDSHDVRFSDALVSSCVVWFRNDSPGESAAFTHGMSLRRPDSSTIISLSHLGIKNKWPPPEASDRPLPKARLKDFFTIRRGIATGDNTFFVLSESEVEARQLAPEFLKPILPSPRYLKTDHVLSDDQGLPLNTPRLFLLDCTGQKLETLPSEVRDYLHEGEKTTAAKKLCAARKNWFDQEQRLPAPFLCSYMGRGNGVDAPVRFILNESKAIATNSFLMLYPKASLRVLLQTHPENLSHVWNLLREIPAEEFRRTGRCYGGGLQKMEPRELGELDCSHLLEWLNHTTDFRYAEEAATGQLLLVMENTETISASS